MKRRNIIKSALNAKLRERDRILFEAMLTEPSEVRVDLLLDELNAAWDETGEDIAERRDLP